MPFGVPSMHVLDVVHDPVPAGGQFVVDGGV